MNALFEDLLRAAVGLLLAAVLLRISWDVIRSLTPLLLLVGILVGVVVLVRCVFHYRRNRYW